MLVHQLYTGTPSGSTTGTTTTLNVQATRTGLVQVIQSAADTNNATLDVEGSLDGGTTWVSLHTFTTVSTSEAAVVTLFPRMRVKFSAITNTPTVKVLIGE